MVDMKFIIDDVGKTESMDIEAWRKHQSTTARTLLERDGSVAPVFLAIIPNPDRPGRLAQIVLPLGEFFVADSFEAVQRQKSDLSRKLRAVVEAMSPVAVIMVTEGWARVFANKSLEEATRELEEVEGIKGYEDRYEVLQIVFETPEGTHDLELWKIERDEKAHPYIGERVSLGGDRAAGRFAGFFTDP
jgi:PAS domain-containing protein